MIFYLYTCSGVCIMNLLRYFEAKAQNRATCDLLRDLATQERVKSLPGAIGKHYRKFDPKSKDYDYFYTCDYDLDKPIIQLLTCGNDVQALIAKNGDVKVVGSHHCGNKALCACCGTREARRVASQLRYMFFLNRNENLDYFMLTLTLPNNFDGFRDEFKIYDKCLPELVRYLGFSGSKSDHTIQYCRGYFATKELTYSKEAGFHPHIHIVLAFDKSYLGSISYTHDGCIKSFQLKTKYVSSKDLSAFGIRDRFTFLIRKYFADYAKLHDQALSDGLNIDFRHIDDIDNSCDEICKYFIDFNSFKDVDSLFIYLRDIFNIRKYSKKGCFGWSEELEDNWRTWCKLGKPTEENLHFISFAGHFDTKDLVFFGMRKGRYLGKTYNFPCYYRKSELLNSGQIIDLHWDKYIQTYTQWVYDSDSRRLFNYIVNPKSLNSIVREVRPDISKLIEDYFDERQRNDEFLMIHIPLKSIEEGG